MMSIVSLNRFMVVDFDAKGYYRINYDHENWLRIIRFLKEDHRRIPVQTRARILDDAFMFAKTNALSFRVPLEMCEYLRGKEDTYVPLLVFASHFDSTRVLLRKVVDTKAMEVSLKIM